jgi:carboxylesterase
VNPSLLHPFAPGGRLLLPDADRRGVAPRGAMARAPQPASEPTGSPGAGLDSDLQDTLPGADGQPPAGGGPCIGRHELFLPGSGARARTGVLLIHGLTGTPNEMRMLGKGLNKAGFSVYAPQLAGHCGSMDDLLHTHWQDWSASVRAAADRLAQHVDHFVVIGLSMGAVLALDLAADGHPRLLGVAALSTMFHHDGWSMPAYVRLWFLIRPLRWLGLCRQRVFMEQPPYGIKDETLRRRVVAQMHSVDSAAAGLPGNPWYSILEMKDLAAHVRARLGRISMPCLVVHAANDDVASVRNAQQVQHGVRGPVELHLLEDSYHMITIDRERRTVQAMALAFVERVSGNGAGAAKGALAAEAAA